MAARVFIAVALIAGLLGSPAWSQSSVQRCESKDGQVTYSNTQCPPGTSPVRKVNTEPPVSSDERKAAQDLAKKESAAAKQVDKGSAEQEARDKRKAVEAAKADAKAQERCERARRDLERARAARSELSERSALSLERMQKADHEISKREALAAKDCAR